MVHAQYSDFLSWIIDLVDDAIGASTSRPKPGKLAMEPMTNAIWIFQERAEHELHYSSRRLFR